MRTSALTRRQFLAASGLALAASGTPAPAKQPCVLENDALRFGITDRRPHDRRAEFREQAGRVNPFLCRPRNSCSSSTTAARYLRVTWSFGSRRRATVRWSCCSRRQSGLEVRVRYRLAPQARYLRKQISVRHERASGRRLLRVDLENWRGVRRGWDSMHADRFPYGSHPVFCDNLWAGVEFVAAFNAYGPDGFTLRSRPGGVPLGSEWVDLHSTVVGVARTGQVRDAFLRYIEDIRLAPARMVACYNSWWTLPKVVKQRDNLALIKQLKADMYDRHGVFFDIITTDMGWSNPRSIWEIDRSILPQGFDDIRGIVESAGGKLGPLDVSERDVSPGVRLRLGREERIRRVAARAGRSFAEAAGLPASRACPWPTPSTARPPRGN